MPSLLLSRNKSMAKTTRADSLLSAPDEFVADGLDQLPACVLLINLGRSATRWLILISVSLPSHNCFIAKLRARRCRLAGGSASSWIGLRPTFVTVTFSPLMPYGKHFVTVTLNQNLASISPVFVREAGYHPDFLNRHFSGICPVLVRFRTLPENFRA